MATPLYECRWKNCTREFDQKELLQAHIISHIDVHEPTRLRDLHDYRKAAGESTASSLPFRYLNTQTSLGSSYPNSGLHAPEPIRAKSATQFSVLGMGTSPAFSAIAPSPSLSSQILSALTSGQQDLQTARGSNPMMGLAAPFEIGPASGVSSAVTAPMAPLTPPPTSEEVKLMDAFTKTPTPPPSDPTANSNMESGTQHKVLDPTTPARKAVKRKNVGGVTFSEATPKNKKRKTIPKTPFPGSDEDAEDDSEDEETEARRAILEGGFSQGEEDPYVLMTQAEGEYFDVEEILTDNSLMGDISLQPEVETDGSESEGAEEGDEIKSQATSSDLRVEDVTPR